MAYQRCAEGKYLGDGHTRKKIEAFRGCLGSLVFELSPNSRLHFHQIYRLGSQGQRKDLADANIRVVPLLITVARSCIYAIVDRVSFRRSQSHLFGIALGEARKMLLSSIRAWTLFSRLVTNLLQLAHGPLLSRLADKPDPVHPRLLAIS